MLPFLNRKEGAATQPVEKIERDHDEGFDLLDAIAEDMLEAFKKGDKGRIKAALEAFVDHIQTLDEEADKKLLGEEK